MVIFLRAHTMHVLNLFAFRVSQVELSNKKKKKKRPRDDRGRRLKKEEYTCVYARKAKDAKFLFITQRKLYEFL